jgi:tRNA-specific 2-thiouridylase
MQTRRVAVALSGGVDSAVAAARLREAGDEVFGVTMRIWDGRAPAAAPGRHACYGPEEEDDLRDAARVCRHLGIELVVIDLAREYRAEILEPCARAYLEGRTPNPCVHCNPRMKFGWIPERLREEGIAFDALATGHYAIVERDAAGGRWLLRRGRDRVKDQSYFLYQLTQEQLALACFPLGTLDKSEVRERARALGLPVAEKPESQDFIAGGYDGLFAAPDEPGPILDEAGSEIGRHRGIRRYTVGQRRGLGLARGEPCYVLALDESRRAVIVGPERSLYADTLVAEAVNWIALPGLVEPRRARVRIRYRHAAAEAVLAPLPQGRVRVTFDAPQRAIAPGQAVVFYEGDLVLGGGIIARNRP